MYVTVFKKIIISFLLIIPLPALANFNYDFNGDGNADVLLQDKASGELTLTLVDPGDYTTVFSKVTLPTSGDKSWSIAGVGDFNGDFKADILFHHNISGKVMLWLMDGTTRTSRHFLTTMPDNSWRIAGVGDLDGDGKTDIFWRHLGSGKNLTWLMDGATRNAVKPQIRLIDNEWKVAGIADSNGDGTDDVLWRHASSGKNTLWLMSAGSRLSVHSLTTTKGYKFASFVDINNDNKADIIWNGRFSLNMFSKTVLSAWLMDGSNRLSVKNISREFTASDKPFFADFNGDGSVDIYEGGRFYVSDENLTYKRTASRWYKWGSFFSYWKDVFANLGYRQTSDQVLRGDFDKDGKRDLFWRNNTTGVNKLQFLVGEVTTKYTNLTTLSDLNWTVAGVGDFDADQHNDILWHNQNDGRVMLWMMNNSQRRETISLTTISNTDFKIMGVADFNNDGKFDVFWRNAVTGDNFVWQMNGALREKTITNIFFPDNDWQAASVKDLNRDGHADVLWRNQTDGRNRIWYMKYGKLDYIINTVTMPIDEYKLVTNEVEGVLYWRSYVNGKNLRWYMNDQGRSSVSGVLPETDTDWKMLNVSYFYGDYGGDILWRNVTTEKYRIWNRGWSHEAIDITAPDNVWQLVY